MLFLLLLLAGCGGGGSSRLSKADFIAKANAICSKYQAKINALPQPKSVKDVPGYIDKALPLLQAGTSQLEGLKAPTELQSTADEWRGILHTQVDQAKSLKTAAEKGDVAGVTRIANGASAQNKRANQLAAQLGAQACAKG
jgi:hypothetical protein